MHIGQDLKVKIKKLLWTIHAATDRTKKNAFYLWGKKTRPTKKGQGATVQGHGTKWGPA